jgi:hypothetical protein
MDMQGVSLYIACSVDCGHVRCILPHRLQRGCAGCIPHHRHPRSFLLLQFFFQRRNAGLSGVQSVRYWNKNCADTVISPAPV